MFWFNAAFKFMGYFSEQGISRIEKKRLEFRLWITIAIKQIHFWPDLLPLSDGREMTDD